MPATGTPVRATSTPERCEQTRLESTPLLQQPPALGADVVVHSATKFIGGHSDLLAGITIGRDQALARRLRRRRGLSGATPGALEAFPALRGLRTLALRLSLGCRPDPVVEAV